MRKIVIIGDSGHAKVIADIINSTVNMSVYATLDDKHMGISSVDGLIKAPIAHLHELIKENSDLRVVIGIGSNRVREKLVQNLGLDATKYITVIHPSSIVSPSAKIGLGTVVMPGAIVNAESKIGGHSIINSGSVVEHDCVIGDYSHISPLAVVTGGVHIGTGAHIGAGASVIPLKRVGKWTTVGAGSVVISDIDANVTVVGSPARIVKKAGM